MNPEEADIRGLLAPFFDISVFIYWDDLPLQLSHSVDFVYTHHTYSIGLMVASIKAISPSVRLYFS